MSIIEARARRALRHADIPRTGRSQDAREDAWVVHDHLGLLGGLAAAFSIGCWSLRRAEDFFFIARRAGNVPRPTPLASCVSTP